MWLRRTSGNHARDRLTFETDVELAEALRHAARARGQEPELVASDLLQQALAQEARRAHTRASLACLTPRQREVAWLAAGGCTNRQIAETLVVSPETVKTHVRHTLDKFGLRSKAELRLMLRDLQVDSSG